ncbi:hypothetical protein RsoM2USA_30 [Ralstonia phage RsoM2USA]|nr:hypothetical protein RsoM2USA_30 [Ralstonia phage RsoM2USA]
MSSKLAKLFGDQFATREEVEISIDDYLELCKTDPKAYASPAQRLLTAIGNPEIIDAGKDARLSRIFGNRLIRRYPAFKDFYGMEDVVQEIVDFLHHAAQNLEEARQILYFLGPVGSAKSSLAEKLKELAEVEPFYTLKDITTGEYSPVNDNPLHIFTDEAMKQVLRDEFNIPEMALKGIPSPWMVEKIKVHGGDLSNFKVVKRYPSKLQQIAVARIEPGDENNQDVSTMVGKVDIRKLEDYPQNHPFAYSYSGGLCYGNRGVVEGVEMFKWPIKVLNPFLVATQEKLFNGTEAIGSMPFDGVIIAHSNEAEWQAFKADKKVEAFIDRIKLIRVPYTLRKDEEVQIYKKLLANSTLRDAPCAPGTLEMMAEFSVMSRLKEPENSSAYSKLRVYNGENIKDTDPRAKPLHEYKDAAGVTEGMTGMSTRFAYKVLASTFNYDKDEVGANPVHLMAVLKNAIIKEQFPQEREQELLNLVNQGAERYIEFIEKELRIAFLESYSDYGQTMFDRYVQLADAWIRDDELRDEATGQLYDRGQLNAELEKIEKPAGIVNPKDFRGEIVNHVLRHRAANKGEAPRWDSFQKIRDVIEKRIFASTEELIPVISFTTKGSKDDQRKHDEFVVRMKQKGYTEKQTQLLVQWWLQYRKSN